MNRRQLLLSGAGILALPALGLPAAGGVPDLPATPAPSPAGSDWMPQDPSATPARSEDGGKPPPRTGQGFCPHCGAPLPVPVRNQDGSLQACTAHSCHG